MMVLQVTRWTPDTCGCVIDLEWDDAVDPKDRVHTAKRILKDCGAHGTRADKHDHLATVLEENQRKNKTFALIQEEDPTFTVDQYEWSFDDERNLRIKLKGTFTADQKARINDKFDAQLARAKS